MQHSRHPVVGLLLGQAFHQCLGLAQEFLVGRRIRPALLDQVVQQLGHLRVKSRVGELIADDRLADIVDDPLGDGIPRERALRVELACDGVVDAGLDDQLGERQLAQFTQTGRRIGLDVGIDEVAHVRLEGLDVQFLARMFLDR